MRKLSLISLIFLCFMLSSCDAMNHNDGKPYEIGMVMEGKIKNVVSGTVRDVHKTEYIVAVKDENISYKMRSDAEIMNAASKGLLHASADARTNIVSVVGDKGFREGDKVYLFYSSSDPYLMKMPE